MDLRKKHPWLFQRGATFYLRAKVPVAAQPFMREKEIKLSLATKDLQVAMVRLRHKAQEVQARFDSAVAKGTKTPERSSEDISNYEMRRLADEHLASLAALFQFNPSLLSGEQRASEARQIEEDDLSAFDIPERIIADTQKAVTSSLSDAGYSADWKFPKASKLAELFIRAEKEALRRRIALLNLDFSVERLPLKLNGDDANEHVAEATRVRDKQPEAATGPTLDILIRKYEADPHRSDIRQKTKEEDKRIFTLIREVIGSEKLTAKISREDCTTFRDMIMLMPKNSQQILPGKSLKECIEIARERRLSMLSAKGANKYISKLSALMNYAVKEQMMGHSPGIGISLPNAKHSKDDRDPFSPDQLMRIIRSEDFIHWASMRFRPGEAGAFWATLLALYIGARQGEICQLEYADLVWREGLPCIHFQDEGNSDKRLKTVYSNRVVPIHPFIIHLGFLDYGNSIHEAGNTILFPDLPRGSDTYHSIVSKRFSRFFSKVGAKTDKTSFHSFRHNCKDKLAEVNTPMHIQHAIGGWTTLRFGSSDNYGSRPSAPQMFEFIEKVSFSELENVILEYVGSR